MDDELKKLMDRVHVGITSFNYNGTKVPCVILAEKRFDEIMAKVAGKPLSVDTNLNILQNGLGNVFVEVSLTFSEGDIEEKLLLYANESLDFFESSWGKSFPPFSRISIAPFRLRILTWLSSVWSR